MSFKVVMKHMVLVVLGSIISGNALFASDSISFSGDETLWIQNNPVVTLAIDNTYPPLNYIDENKNLTGLSVDYVRYIAKKAGISVQFDDSVWSVAIKKALDHEVDGIVNADATEERKAYLNFTSPYATYPCGLVTLKKAESLENIQMLDGKVVCMKSNSSHLELISRQTRAVVYEIETLEEGLELLIKGEVFGVFDDVSVLGYLISKYHFVNLKVNFIHYDDVVGVARLGLRNNDDVMLQVFNKAIQSMSKKEKEAIQARWLSPVREKIVLKKQFDWGVFLKIIIPVFGVFIITSLLILIHNNRLKRVVGLRTHELKESREEFRTLIDNAADAVFVYDMNGRIVMVNQQACSTLGYLASELLSMTIAEIDNRFSNAETFEYFMKSLSPGQPVTREGAHIRKDGTSFPVEIRIGLIEHSGHTSVLALARDISERKKTEQDRLLLSTIIEQSSASIMVTDSKGLVQYVNPSFERITGYRRDEIVGKMPGVLTSDQHSDDVYETILTQIRSGQVWRGHLVNRHKNGSLYEEEAAISPITDSSGNVINYVAINRDVTQEMNLERRLRQAQKMEAIGTLAGGIAHDFNNILSIILGYAELTIDKVEEDPGVSGYVDEILKAGSRAKDLVQQILAFSRKTEIKKQRISISPIIKEVSRFMRASLPATIQINTEIDIKSDIINADPTQIHQVIMNLCTNAGHAMKENGGDMTLSLNQVELTEDDLEQYPELSTAGIYLRLSITDTGTGISAQDMERIFEPYYTTKEVGQGTGLGLAAVHGIIKEHWGDVSVYSEIGSGTVFNIILPLIDGKEDQPEYRSPSALPTGTETILIVDDEPAIVAIMETMLSNLGYSVVTADNPFNAVELFKTHRDSIDAVITDKTMPGMTGFQLAEMIREIQRDIPVIVSSGFIEAQDQDKKEIAGILEIILKPVNKKNLAETIRFVLDGHTK